jgi:uncharacterized membrane protein YeaQ/YmgE (transglycosylase-associated protein family)
MPDVKRADTAQLIVRNAKDNIWVASLNESLALLKHDSGRREGMMDAQGFLGNPGVGFLEMLLIGAIAGWLAERVTSSNHSIFTNILVGIAGAFVGGVLASLLNIPVFGFIRTLVAAIIGAILILFIWHRARTTRTVGHDAPR